MKVLKNNFNQTESFEKEVNKVESYPRKLICENCQSELEYEKSDLKMDLFGCMSIHCPLCGYDNMLEDNEDSITLTADNVEFPVHFYHTSEKTGAINCCNTEEIRKNILKAIDCFRRNKEECYWGGHITGNLYINVRRWSGDEMYEVTVSNDFYSTEIPFESEDY